MPTIRLDTDLEARLERLAGQRGQSKSEVIRDALEHFAHAQEDRGASALDRLKAFVGVADSGGQQLSATTGEGFRKKLAGDKVRNPGRTSSGVQALSSTQSTAKRRSENGGGRLRG